MNISAGRVPAGHGERRPTARAVRDVPADRTRLLTEVERLRPRLVVLDLFVRLHRIDENAAAAEVAPLLAYPRERLRVVLVHHARKGGHGRAGQALRGSSELHAWGDSNLYLRRDGERLLLSIEHRAAESSSGIELALGDRGSGLTLHVREDAGPVTAEQPLARRKRPRGPRRRRAAAEPPRAPEADGRIRVEAEEPGPSDSGGGTG